MKKFFAGKRVAGIAIIGLIVTAGILCLAIFENSHDIRFHKKDQATDESIESGKIYNVGEYLSLKLPDGIRLGDFQTDISGVWPGCLFEGEFEEMFHGDYCPEAWYSPGGIGIIKREFMPPNTPVFEDGELKLVELMLNEGGRKSDYERVEGCRMQAIIGEYCFNLFNALEWMEYCEENDLPEEKFWEVPVSNYWYVFLADEDSKYVYELYLNQEYFDKNDAMAIARTVVFFD